MEIARKLLVVVWHVLTHQAADRHADVAMVTRKLQRWGKSHQLAHLYGLSRGAFARQHLQRLRLESPRTGQAEREPGGELLPTPAVCCT